MAFRLICEICGIKCTFWQSKIPITEKAKKPQLEEKTDVPKRSEAELKQEERYYELLIKKANANIAEIGSEEGRQDE